MFIAHTAPFAYPLFSAATAFTTSAYVSPAVLLNVRAFFPSSHVTPVMMPVPCPLPVPFTRALAMHSITLALSSCVIYPSNAETLILRAFSLIENTFIISYPSKETLVTAGSSPSTAAPSVCQLAAAVGVPIGTATFEGMLKALHTPIRPPIVRAFLTTSLSVWVGSTAAALAESVNVSALWSPIARLYAACSNSVSLCPSKDLKNALLYSGLFNTSPSVASWLALRSKLMPAPVIGLNALRWFPPAAPAACCCMFSFACASPESSMFSVVMSASASVSIVPLISAARRSISSNVALR